MSASKRSDHETALLKNLNWFLVEQRIDFKILLTTYNILHGQSADYLKPLIEVYCPLRNNFALRFALRLILLCSQTIITDTYEWQGLFVCRTEIVRLNARGY